MSMNTERKNLVRYFEGFPIYRDVDGFYWVNGVEYGYFETIEEAKEDIAHFNRVEETRG